MGLKRTKVCERVAAALWAVVLVWRLPRALALGESTLFAATALSLVLAAGLYALLQSAFACREKRLCRICYGLGALFGLFQVVGADLRVAGGFPAYSLVDALDGLLTAAALATAYGAAMVLVFQWVSRRQERGAKAGGMVQRVLGNGYVIFALLLCCWAPVWLALWPGTFSADNVTQLYGYVDGAHNTHHPLLHTLLLGACVSLGMEHTADGSAAMGLALYSVMQMVAVAAMLRYAIVWLKRRKPPFWARAALTGLVALHPFYTTWPFCAQKDVLFACLSLMLVLQIVDLWREGKDVLRSPLRIAAFVLTAVLMMLMRNNGVYAFVLLIPVGVALCRRRRARMALLCAGCVAAYMAANAGLVALTEAESGSKVEMLSIPLQQLGRTMLKHPDALEDDDRALLVDELYEGNDPGDIYEWHCADRLKWEVSYDAVDESLPELLSLWVRTGLREPVTYLEAFLLQNQPYFAPGAELACHLEIDIIQPEIFPIEDHSYLPGLQALYQDYDRTLTFQGLPGVRLLSDPAFMVWLCMAGLGLACYRRERGVICGFAFLLAVWATCLLGPIAIIRYVLGLFYAAPVLWAAILAPRAAKDGENTPETSEKTALPQPVAED